MLWKIAHQRVDRVSVDSSIVSHELLWKKQKAETAHFFILNQRQLIFADKIMVLHWNWLNYSGTMNIIRNGVSVSFNTGKNSPSPWIIYLKPRTNNFRWLMYYRVNLFLMFYSLIFNHVLRYTTWQHNTLMQSMNSMCYGQLMILFKIIKAGKCRKKERQRVHGAKI